MQNTKNYRTFFTIAALWNWGAVLLFLYIALFNHSLMGFFLLIIPASFIWYYLFLALAAVFGLGYYWVGQDIRMNRNIIKMGIIGKMLVFLLLLHGFFSGAITILTAAAGIVDLVFAIFFANVLVKTYSRVNTQCRRSE